MREEQIILFYMVGGPTDGVRVNICVTCEARFLKYSACVEPKRYIGVLILCYDISVSKFSSFHSICLLESKMQTYENDQGIR